MQKKNSEFPTIKIGLIADPQYADKPPQGQRLYRESLWKLKKAINEFNDKEIDFVQTLGDVIDSDWESFDKILPIYNQLNPEINNYHILGNHDFNIDDEHKPKLLKKLSMSYFTIRISFMIGVLLL